MPIDSQDLIPLFRATPFKPFDVYMNDGSNYEVRHPDQAMVMGEVLLIAEGRQAIRLVMRNISRVETTETADA